MDTQSPKYLNKCMLEESGDWRHIALPDYMHNMTGASCACFTKAYNVCCAWQDLPETFAEADWQTISHRTVYRVYTEAGNMLAKDDTELFI